MTDKEKIKILKHFCIFMCSVYQKNYEECADGGFLNREDLDKKEKDLRLDIMMNFSTVQGFKLRKFVSDLSHREYPRGLILNNLIKIFKESEGE